MGGLNHPDLATKAGEEPLPQSDDSDIGEQMDVDDEVPINEDSCNLVHLAGNASPLVEGNRRGQDEDRFPNSEIEITQPKRPKILTNGQSSGSRDESHTFLDDHNHRESGPLNLSIDGAKGNVDRPRSQYSPSRSLSSGMDESDSAAISPMLRRFTIPNSERSPTETLPAMHNSPPSSSSKSSTSQQNLPSLRAIALEPLLDSRSPTEVVPHGISRPAFSIGTGALNSPPMTSMTPRPGQFPSPQTRMSGQFPCPYTHGHPSPAYSDASPRERDSTKMSPPSGLPSSQGYYANGRAPQNEELTPQSAGSHHSGNSFSTAASPHPQQMDVDPSRPMLPPLAGLSGGALIAGSFKCDYAGCTAAPFQTQYLLK